MLKTDPKSVLCFVYRWCVPAMDTESLHNSFISGVMGFGLSLFVSKYSHSTSCFVSSVDESTFSNFVYEGGH